MGLTDESLVSACKRGDETAWESLIRRYQRLIYSIPRRAGLDEFSSAEVFQNVFASLIEKLDQIEHPDRIKAWLVTTARRETWRIIRIQRESYRAASSPENERDEIIELPDDAPLPDEVLLRLEQQHKLRDAVEGLDERCRKLLEMLFYSPEAPPYSDVAAALGLPEGSIGPTRARCLKKLLRSLEKMGL
ncbi:MAG: sigma-70 family RNA polymerase sigma factor [Blastocatellia bacterium]